MLIACLKTFGNGKILRMAREMPWGYCRAFVSFYTCPRHWRGTFKKLKVPKSGTFDRYCGTVYVRRQIRLEQDSLDKPADLTARKSSWTWFLSTQKLHSCALLWFSVFWNVWLETWARTWSPVFLCPGLLQKRGTASQNRRGCLSRACRSVTRKSQHRFGLRRLSSLFTFLKQIWNNWMIKRVISTSLEAFENVEGFAKNTTEASSNTKMLRYLIYFLKTFVWTCWFSLKKKSGSPGAGSARSRYSASPVRQRIFTIRFRLD
jgi:hypothetical protein